MSAKMQAPQELESTIFIFKLQVRVMVASGIQAFRQLELHVGTRSFVWTSLGTSSKIIPLPHLLLRVLEQTLWSVRPLLGNSGT
jgi:hypothetical protein